MSLSDGLTALLVAICQGNPGEDGLLPYHSRKDLMATLWRGKGALSELVYRLRQEELYETYHLNPWLVDVAEQGIRFLARQAIVTEKKQV